LPGGDVISLRLLGPPEIRIDGDDPPPELLWRKHLALLVYLHCHAPRGLGRAHLLDLLWGDKPEAAARHSLNEALRVLRRALGDEAVDTSGDQVRLAAPVDGDLRRVESLLAAGDAAGAAACFGGEFLEGFEVPGAAPFGDWLAAVRLEWRRRGSDLLAAEARSRLDRGDAEGAADLADRAVALDPVNQGAALVAMRALALQGDRAGALGHHDRYVAAVAAVGLPVTGPVTALAARIRVYREGPATLARAEPARSRRAPLVGRELPLSTLLEDFAQCLDGGARLALVAGEPGTGRSRLLEEVVERARLAGASTLVLGAVAADADDPGGGLRALAGGALHEAPGVAAASPEALAALAGTHPRWAELFPGVRGVQPVSLRQGLIEVLRATAGETPVLLAVDDAQWLDGESLRALIGLLRDMREERLFVVLAHTSTPPRPELEDATTRLGRDISGVRVELGPLQLGDMEGLVRWVLPGYAADAVSRLARRIAVDSAGLPLLAVELLHAVAGGLDLLDQPSWPEPFRTLDQTRPGDLPDTVVSAIRLGFRRLGPAAQRVLTAAAVLGERVPAERLGRGAGVAGAELFEALDELEWHRWMRAEPRGYAYVARIAREVVARDLVTPGQRHRMLEAADPA